MKVLYTVLIIFLLLAILFAPAGNMAADSFMGQECTDDCSGHQEGYDWAERNDITSEDDCSSPSASFEEGCNSYVEENAGDSDEDSYEDSYEDRDSDW